MSEQADGQQFSSAPAETGTPDTSGTQSTPDPVLSRLDELSSRLDSIVPAQQQQQEDFTSLDELLSGYNYEDEQDQGFDPQQQPQQFDQTEYEQQQALAQLQQMIAEQAKQAINPYAQQLEQMRTQQHAAALEAKYPELQKGEVASRVVKAAAQTAQAMGYEMGLSPDQVAALSRNPRLLESTYLAERARQQAAQETPVSGDQVHLESTGANPGMVEDDYAARIANLGPQRSNGFNWI